MAVLTILTILTLLSFFYADLFSCASAVTDEKVKILTRTNLDYECVELRSVTLYVDVTDGFCDANTYSVTVKVTDVIEPPVIVPSKTFERTVYEGLVSITD